MKKKIDKNTGDTLIVRHRDGTEEEIEYALCFQFDKFVEGDIRAKDTNLTVRIVAHGETPFPALLMYKKADAIWGDLGRTITKEYLRKAMEMLADEDL